MIVKLPEPLGEYFAAANERDADRVAACFAEDGLVHDEGQDISGRDAVRAWADETGRKYRYRADVLSVGETADRTVVKARVTGEFPGSPVELQYRFKLSGRRIAALEIG